jgi:hypothetical protein
MRQKVVIIGAGPTGLLLAHYLLRRGKYHVELYEQLRLIIEYYLRLKFHRILHRWFPQWVKPFIFDLVLDYDLPYSQILSFHQGWVERVKRSLPT